MRKFNHLVYWIVMIVLLTLVFGYTNGKFSEAFYFVAMLMPIVVCTSYFFNYTLVPKFLMKRSYFKFTLYAIYTMIVSVYLEMLVIFLSFILLANYQFGNMNPVATNVFLLTFVLYGVVFLNGFILLLRKSFTSDQQISDFEKDQAKQEKRHLLVRANRQTSKIFYEEIEYIESLADYVKIILVKGEPVITKERISAIAEKLPTSFYRIHRSFIVNEDHVKSFSKESVNVGSQELPISRTYKKEVENRLTRPSVG